MASEVALPDAPLRCGPDRYCHDDCTGNPNGVPITLRVTNEPLAADTFRETIWQDELAE